MRFLRRLLQPGDDLPTVEAPSAPVDRRQAPAHCRGCGRPNPPYVFAENEHHYCIDCARRSWKLMRLRPIARRREDKALARSVVDDEV